MDETPKPLEAGCKVLKVRSLWCLWPAAACFHTIFRLHIQAGALREKTHIHTQKTSEDILTEAAQDIARIGSGKYFEEVLQQPRHLGRLHA